MTFSPSRIVGAVCATAVIACLLACGATARVREAAARTQRSNDFKQLGVAYHQYLAVNQSGPADQQAFLQWAQKMEPEAVPFIQQTGPGGPIKFEYGKWRMPKDFEQGTSNTVLASDSTTWTGGIKVVLMADGSVRTMTDAELAAAPRPKKGKD
jgi:hypothetical protein